MRRSTARAAGRLFVVVATAAAALLGCSPARSGGARLAPQRSLRPSSDTVALPSDGWKPGDPAMQALLAGAFHAVRVGASACAWLGDHRAPFLWPDGWSVRFTPTPQLINAKGKVVAEEGQHVSFGGGLNPSANTTPCGQKGQWTNWVMQQ